ncbi:hypothetical protein WJX73_007624 [Symbiochloris irregularis]|uniref:phosphoserine phosphatase n=1 Tax=Symbiochloris irregularis TaxID=706552 RepID=A0AAW1NV28_9CHLO
MPDKETSPSQTTLQIWQSANAVCIDVDSTLCIDESIDVFAEWLGVGQAVAELTANAMQGGVKFEEALAARLDLMHPSKQKVQDFVASHPPQYSPGIPELVKALHQRGTAVFLVSGGFHAIIDPIAQHLGIPADHVFANTILFKDDEAGSYAGFDRDEFTSRSGGKLSAVKHIKAEYGHKVVVAMGDGATDLEARQPGGADIFIGYGGSVYRPTVAAGADWFVMSIQPLLDALIS